MWDKVFWFPNGRKEHTKKFLKQWFGPYKIISCLLNNIVLFVNINKFEPNPILVNINKFKLSRYLGQAPRGLEATSERGESTKRTQNVMRIQKKMFRMLLLKN
jgi:hypothetical protein